MKRLWYIACIQDFYHPDVRAGLPDGRWPYAVAEPYASNFLERVHAAWWILTGRAHAMLWPKAGDLEGIFHRDPFVEADRPPRPFVSQQGSVMRPLPSQERGK